jgi:alpha-tubulin suppressor-like RCC1 family protein
MYKRRNIMARYIKSTLKISLALVICLSLLGSIKGTAQAQVEDAWIQPETISSGLAHSCGIRGNGTLTCWGRNDHGQATPPTGTFRQVSAGRFHTCGIRSNGTVACWGEDLHNKITPPAGTFVQLSAGDQHTCGVRNSGALYCWGKNDDGQTTYPTIGKSSNRSVLVTTTVAACTMTEGYIAGERLVRDMTMAKPRLIS